MVTQRTANPRTPVQFRAWPPIFSSLNSHHLQSAGNGFDRCRTGRSAREPPNPFGQSFWPILLGRHLDAGGLRQAPPAASWRLVTQSYRSMPNSIIAQASLFVGARTIYPRVGGTPGIRCRMRYQDIPARTGHVLLPAAAAVSVSKFSQTAATGSNSPRGPRPAPKAGAEHLFFASTSRQRFTGPSPTAAPSTDPFRRRPRSTI